MRVVVVNQRRTGKKGSCKASKRMRLQDPKQARMRSDMLKYYLCQDGIRGYRIAGKRSNYPAAVQGRVTAYEHHHAGLPGK